MRKPLIAAGAIALSACSSEPPASEGDSDPFADSIERFDPHPEASFGHSELPEIVLGPPGGTLDVASLGCEGEIVLRFDAPGITDGPGADLIVFENPFDVSFPEPGQVAVSEDGEQWFEFACDPVSLEGCAGVSVTLAQPDHPESAQDPERAGGDAFDLAALGPDAPQRVLFVRIRDRSREYWQAQGLNFCDPGQGGAGGFDLDAIAAVRG